MSFWKKMKNALVGNAPEKAAEDEQKRIPKQAADQVADNPKPDKSAAEIRSDGGSYRKVKVSHGPGGWGGPLVVECKPGKDLIYSVTGGGIHPLAKKIADLSGGKAFDGFSSKASFDEIAIAIIDCGGTARVGVYPMKNVLTVDIYPTSPSGPLIKFISEKNFVSGVRLEDIQSVD